MEIIKQILKSFISNEALKKLYLNRQLTRPADGNRNKLTVTICGLLFLGLSAFIIQSALARRSPAYFLEAQKQVVFIDSKDQKWETAGFFARDCTTFEACIRFLKNKATFDGVLAVDDLTKWGKHSTPFDQTSIASLRLSIDPNRLGPLLDEPVLMLVLPAARYLRAEVFVNDKHVRTYWQNRRVAAPFPLEGSLVRPIQVEVFFEFPANQSGVFQISEFKDSSLFLSTQGAYESYMDQQALERAQRGDAVGAIARLVLALFVLILFLFVDSSPESLGLALFMGFEAIPKVFAYTFGDTSVTSALSHYSLQMGDIFRLYFALQIGRLVGKSAYPWLVWGSVLSIPYGLLRSMAPLYGLQWPNELSNIRDIIIGGAGFLICVRASYFLYGKNLPWRTAALALASLAFFEQLVDPIGSYIPLLGQMVVFQSVVDLLQPYSAYLFAMSAFVNISSMENRVRALSVAKARAEVIEKDLELGRALQKTFLNVPSLPAQFAVACHHEAALYVSGDTYFVKLTKDGSRILFLINDVTGHGIQAALKASACHVMAQTVWSEAATSSNEDWDHNGALSLPLYDRCIEDYMQKTSSSPDLTSMIGGEFSLASGVLKLYRANFTFPIVITPSQKVTNHEDPVLGEAWSIHVMAIANRTLTAEQIPKGSFVLLLSDGYIGSSRMLAGFLRYLRRSLAKCDLKLSATGISQIILNYEGFLRTGQGIDDRTLLVFQWTFAPATTTISLSEDETNKIAS